MGIRDWVWRTLTEHGRAWEAYEKSDSTYEVTLEILEPGYRRTLEDITSVGWRLDSEFKHPRVRMTDVTPKSDGGHEVVRTVSQKTTFYFVRAGNHLAPVERPASSSTWGAGWYQTDHGWRWWDGMQWTQSYTAPPEWAYREVNREAGYSSSSSGEIALHLVLTMITCGLWVPVWMRLARKRRGAVLR